MQRISIPWVIEIAAVLDGLNAVATGPLSPMNWHAIFNAKNQLEALFSASPYGPFLRSTRTKHDSLQTELNRLLTPVGNSPTGNLTEYDVWNMKNLRDQFKMVFLSELNTIPTYLVTGKESFDVNLLIDAGVGLFPRTLLVKAPETERDAMQAGRALAFELGTACGFHVFRVTESVVRRYWDEVSGSPRPNLETLGNFAAEMHKKGFGDTKIVEAIKQMTKLHRNPLIHPEVILSVEEAIGIVGIARSVVGAILTVLPDAPLTISSPLPALYAAATETT
ncbi:hypothetical protein [Aurantimonas manganoxydans]|uniref:hypothetical protein n=1 Tax=Aurantimonas manganoxydans TaxID=651183 RepID=UPI000A898C8F|nr:hypothetical protein [Aurantimonas manganoxydans]